MKLRNLFYLLLALPLVFAACEKNPEDVDKTEYAADLTLTSEDVMEVAAEAGDYEITYTANMVEVTRYSPKPEPEPEAVCEADWVTIGDVTPAKTTFSVTANDGEARETKIVVKYSTESVEVTVKQAAKEQGEPENPEQPKEPVTFEAVAFTGDYTACVEEGVDNWFFTVADKPFAADGKVDPAANAYVVDLYIAAYEGEWSETMTLPVGEYNLNVEDSVVAGTFGSEHSVYLAAGAEAAFYEAGKLVVTEGGLTLTVTIDGVEHTVTYKGEMTLANDSEKPVTVTELKFENVWAIYYGDFYSPETADNYYFFFSDKGWDEDGYEVANGKYYRFDIYTELIDTTDGLDVPYGTYNLSDEFGPGIISSGVYYSMDEDAWDLVEDEEMEEATITFSETGVVANVVIAGQAYKLVYEGAEYPISDESAYDSGEDGPLSDLTEDLTLNITGATLVLEDYGDYYYNGTNNYAVYVYEDLEGETGAYFMFDILTPGGAANIAGEYTLADNEQAYTAFTAYYDSWEEEFYGAWYVNMDTYEMAPIVDGSFTIAIADDGTYTITLNCADDLENAITGTIVGKEYGADEGGNEGGNEGGDSYENWSFKIEHISLSEGTLTLTDTEGTRTVACVLKNSFGSITEGTYHINDTTGALYVADIVVDGVPATEASGTIRISGSYYIVVDMTIDGVKYTGTSTNSIIEAIQK